MRPLLIALCFLTLLASPTLAREPAPSDDDCTKQASELILAVGTNVLRLVKKIDPGTIATPDLERLEAIGNLLVTAPDLKPEKRLAAVVRAEGELHADHGKKYQRKSGAIIACDFNYKAMSSREFFEALITEITVPALDGGSKEPAYIELTLDPERVELKNEALRLAHKLHELPCMGE